MNSITNGLSYLSKLEQWKGGGRFGLGPIRKVLQHLGDPQTALPIIHVAGTNGKGSVAVMVASILGTGGYRVGLNISPHLSRMHERVCVDGKSASDDLLGEFANDIRVASEQQGVVLSFHEAITAVAFLAFRELGLEWAVFEVGLGGRDDCSNVIVQPAVSIIVSIDLDHQNVLGKTIPEIALIKADIIKRGRPVVAGILSKEAFAIVERKANLSHAPLSVLGRDFFVRDARVGEFGRWEGQGIFPKKLDVSLPMHLSLPGQHQIENASVAIAAGLELGLPPSTCSQGVSSAFWPARLENLEFGGRNFILDSAHNPAGVKRLISFLDSIGEDRIDLTFGALEDKDWKEMIALLAPRVSTWRVIRANSARSLEPTIIAEHITACLSSNDIRVLIYEHDYEKYLREVIVDGDGKVYVAGSTYLVGVLRELLVSGEKPLWSRSID